MKKIFFLLFISSYCAAAYRPYPCSPYDSCETCNPGDYCYSPPPEMPDPKPLTSIYNAPYDEPCTVDIGISYLLWTVYQDGLNLYTEHNQENFGTTDQKDYFEQSYLQGEYSSAFKINATIGFSSDNWQLSADYLWYYQSFSNSFAFNPDSLASTAISLLFPSYCLKSSNHTPRIATPTDLKSKWELCIDMIDAAFSRKYFIGKHLSFCTLLGLKTAFIDQQIKQTFNIQYASEQIDPDFVDATLTNGKATQKTTSWGVGPTAGLKTDWLFCKGFHLLSNASISLLYTNYNLKGEQTGFLFRPNADPSIQNQNQDIEIETLTPQTLRPIGRLQVGISNSYNVCYEIDCELSIYYDFMAMWHQNMFRTIEIFTAGSKDPDRFVISYEDLYLHGLTISAIFKF